MNDDDDDLPDGIVLWTCVAILGWAIAWAWLT